MEIPQETNREDLINYFLMHCSDIIPYDDPDYDKKLMAMAEHYADEILDTNSHFNQICDLHDKMFDDGLINF